MFYMIGVDIPTRVMMSIWFPGIVGDASATSMVSHASAMLACVRPDKLRTVSGSCGCIDDGGGSDMNSDDDDSDNKPKMTATVIP